MTIPIDKLTIKAQEALQAAQQMTLQAGNPEVTTVAFACCPPRSEGWGR